MRLLRPSALVSLTFDDGTRDHLSVAELLADRGLAATFYVNSGLVGTDGRLTWTDVDAIAALGHEIGGHTRTHVDLTGVARDEAAAEVADDRRDLCARGFAASSFAYPYGSWNEELEPLVAAAGYAAARRSWGLAPDARTHDRPRAESVPPERRFAIRTYPSVERPVTVEGLLGAVRRAARARGWLPVVFHGVGEGESRYDVSASFFEAFVDRLASAGPSIRVKRLAEVAAE